MKIGPISSHWRMVVDGRGCRLDGLSFRHFLWACHRPFMGLSRPPTENRGSFPCQPGVLGLMPMSTLYCFRNNVMASASHSLLKRLNPLSYKQHAPI